MTRFQMLLLFLVAITLTPYLSAQDLVGSTTLDIDPSTNIVTATCETDMYDGDYEASVQCWVVDGAGNIVASQGYVDHGGQGYAQVVLTFQGQLGTNYIATASHVAIFNIVDLPSGPGQPTYYEDYYNYSYFEQGGAQTYPDYFDWYGPGPVVQVRKNNAHTGNTTKSAAIAPSLTMKFTDSKSPGDNLLFSAGGVPSETLGRKDFPNYWSWSIEGSAVVVDEASKWKLTQSVVTSSASGIILDDDFIPHVISNPLPIGIDPIPSAFIQNPAGSKMMFWIDSPGPAKTGTDQFGNQGTVDSETWIANFKDEVCSTITTSVCASVNWYVKIIVNSGHQLDTTSSSAGLGTAP